MLGDQRHRQGVAIEHHCFATSDPAAISQHFSVTEKWNSRGVQRLFMNRAGDHGGIATVPTSGNRKINTGGVGGTTHRLNLTGPHVIGIKSSIDRLIDPVRYWQTYVLRHPLQQGTIADRGSHAELIGRSAAYRDLVDAYDQAREAQA